MSGSIAELVAGEGRVEVEGFTYSEGPAWDRADRCLYFNDIPADTTHRLLESGELQVVAHPSGYANGMAIDAAGRLLVCRSAENSLIRREADGATTVLASHFDGKELNSPNDLVLHSSGDLFFTDPAYGRIPVYGRAREQELSFQGVYRLTADGELELLSDQCEQPNGICLSPDERWLYVADTESGAIVRFDLGASDHSPGETWVERAGPPLSFADAYANRLVSGYVDGMGCDELGNVYVTAPGGIAVFDPGAQPLGTIPFPEDLANFTWGGEDGRTLYVCCRTRIISLPMAVSAAGGGRA